MAEPQWFESATTDAEGTRALWVSLDGELWLPVNRLPRMRSEVEVVFDGRPDFKPLTFGTLFLRHTHAGELEVRKVTQSEADRRGV